MTSASRAGWRNRVIGIIGVMLCAAAPAAAQGNSHGNPSGQFMSTVTTATHGAHDPSIAGTGVRNFGSWLDDATVQDPGGGFLTFGVGVYRTPIYRETDFPSIDSGFGVSRRLQVGMSVPYAHGGAPGDPRTHGFGDAYVSAKYQLREPSTAGVGFAVIPMVEVLSVAPPSGGSRVQWALPLSAERRFDGWRVMGTGGYFSRGSAFGAGAAEVALSDRAWVTGSLSHSYSIKQDDLSTALGLQRSRTDLSGGLTYAVRPDIAVYGTLGRTISARDDNSATLMFSAGVSLGVQRPIHKSSTKKHKTVRRG